MMSVAGQRVLAATAFALVASLAAAQTTEDAPGQAPPRTVVIKESGTPVELVGYDPAARRVSVVDDQGVTRVFLVDPRSALLVASARPGDLVFLSHRYDKRGRAEAVVRLARRRGSAHGSRFPDGAEIISVDRASHTVTIRRGDGSSRRLRVDERSLRRIEDARPGDRIAFEGGSVVVTRR